MADDQENPSDDDVAAQWEAMMAGDASAPAADANTPTTEAEGAEASAADSTEEDWSKELGLVKVLNQDEIDNLLGFEMHAERETETHGLKAMLERALLSYERLPMLEVVFDRFVRILSTSLRNYTSDNIDIDIRSITSLRFEDYINSIPMPALLTVFKVMEWENFGIITADGSLIYSFIDVLFGGRRSMRPIRIEGRPYTTIEQGIVRQISEIMLTDMGAAFDPLSPATFQFERMETNPRFATIARPADAAILLQLRVDMEERGGNMEVLIPYATLEPIRELLLQVYMGEKFGRDSLWEAHLQSEVSSTHIELEATLKPKQARMFDIMQLKVGSTIIMDDTPDDDIQLHCHGICMLEGKIGRSGNNVAIHVTNPNFKNRKEPTA
jgi:flagellar motor switch protein FliM